jgi:hypothetical protein
MFELIQALAIFARYLLDTKPPYRVTSCEHDELFVAIDPKYVSEADILRLGELGFLPEGDHFRSYCHGSC